MASKVFEPSMIFRFSVSLVVVLFRPSDEVCPIGVMSAPLYASISPSTFLKVTSFGALSDWIDVIAALVFVVPSHVT